MPDPPLDIQVEAGPQEGTLLVTWLPVTITATGKSNGAEVRGYAIYLDSRHVKNVNSPTGEKGQFQPDTFILFCSNLLFSSSPVRIFHLHLISILCTLPRHFVSSFLAVASSASVSQYPRYLSPGHVPTTSVLPPVFSLHFDTKYIVHGSKKIIIFLN